MHLKQSSNHILFTSKSLFISIMPDNPRSTPENDENTFLFDENMTPRSLCQIRTVFFIWLCCCLHTVSQVARELQARLNTQQNLAQNLHHKFDDISNAHQDADDNSTSPPKKRQRTGAILEDSPDSDKPSVTEAETNEVKRFGHWFVILHGLWLREKEHIFQVEFNEGYDEKQQFKDTNTMVQGQLHEIKGLLLEKYDSDAFMKVWLSRSVSYECIVNYLYWSSN